MEEERRQTNLNQLKCTVTSKEVNECENNSYPAAYRCPFCPEAIFEESDGLIEHLKLHSTYVPNHVKTEDTVKTEGKGGTSSSSATISQIKKPTKENKVPKSSKKHNKLLSCTICSYTCPGNFKLNKHMKIHSSANRPWKCVKCSSHFLNLQNLRTHESVRHGNGMSSATLNNGSFQCLICSKILTWKNNLQRHVKRFHKGNGKMSVPVDSNFKVLSSNSPSKKRKSDTKIASKYSKVFKTSKLRVDAQTNRLSLLKTMKLHKCGRCPRSFPNKHHLKRHIKIHNSNARWKCFKCNSRFTSSRGFHIHNNDFHGRKPINTKKRTECGICRKMVVNMKSHLSVHSQVKQFHCQICRKEFTRKDNLKAHMETIHSAEICDQQLSTSKEATSMLQSKSVKKAIKFKRAGASQTNKCEEGGLTSSIIRDGDATDGTFKCPHCVHRFFEDGQELIEHLLQHRRTQTYTDLEIVSCNVETSPNGKDCNDVDKRTEVVPSFCKPKLRSTSGIMENEWEVERGRNGNVYKCIKCPYASFNLNRLKKHVSIHNHPSRPWKCSACPAYFRFQQGLKYHEKYTHRVIFDEARVASPRRTKQSKLHSQNRNVDKSEKTAKTDVRPVDGKDHFEEVHGLIGEQQNRATDPREKPAAHSLTIRKNATCRPCKIVLTRCDDEFAKLCGARSTKSATISSEPANKHTKQNTCPICKKIFSRSSSVKIHLRIHTGEKPFKCPIPKCPMQFRQSGDRNRHVKRHHSFQYRCRKCPGEGYKCRSKEHLNRHLKKCH